MQLNSTFYDLWVLQTYGSHNHKVYYQIWKMCLNSWDRECKKRIRLTFNCKVGQSDLIATKLNLDVSCFLPAVVYTKFQIDIPEHVERKARILRKIQTPIKIVNILFFVFR